MALRIKFLRDRLGWTQDYLATLSNISRSQLAQIEMGTRPANTLRLNTIALALGVELPRLFSMSEDDDLLLDLASSLSAEDRQVLIRIARSLASQDMAADN
jgi:transcriptional regulator with XRE-family HTH domain